MRSPTPRLVISRRQALAVVAYVGLVIALLAVSVLLVVDLRDKSAEIAAAQMRLDQLSERSRSSLSASNTSNAGPSGSPFLDGKTITIAGAALQQRIEAAVAKADGLLTSSQLELDGPDAKNGFVNLTGMPYVFVDKLSIQSPEVFGEPESGRMRMTIGVAGQWRSSE
jgi:general secretion pathway protein M